MRLSLSSIYLALLCAASPVFSAATPVPKVSGIDLALSRAADLAIDLSKMPAWEPVEALGLTPIETGPGLPTLKELNMTWADLMKPIPGHSENPNALEKRWNYTPNCNFWVYSDHSYANYCWNYLNGLGSTTCAVPAGTDIRFCGTGVPGSFYGTTQSGAADSSTCANIAAGATWVLSNCMGSNWLGGGQLFEGRNAAWGNGHIVVRVT